jgi:glutaminyl-peptide cyclotransferase
MLNGGFNLKEPPVSRTEVKPRHTASTSGIPWHYIALAGVVAGLVVLATWNGGPLLGPAAAPSKLTLDDIPFDGARAYEHLQAICAIGPRVSGTEGMRKQQEYLRKHFETLGGRVSEQKFVARHPLQGSNVPMANLIVEWHPERKERILLCAHYDTRPFPDQDPVNPRGVFIGANDGASGVALLCELAQHMPKLQSRYGVDFVLFDGEELVYDGQRDPYFLGSEHFATEYKANPPQHKYVQGILLDMVADAQLQLYREVNSMRTSEQKKLVNSIWSTARDLGVREFIFITRHEVRDDHVPLNEIARIPTIDIIDFEYPTTRANYWHTTRDIPENCSPLSLAKVGWVLHTWLQQRK